MNYIFKSKEFNLRWLKPNDAKNIYEKIQDEQIFKYITSIPQPYTLQNAKDFIKKSLEKLEKKEGYEFVIEIDNELQGVIGLAIKKEHNKAELGYWISKDMRGKGIVTSAVKQIIKYGFNKLKLKRIYARFLDNNTSSERVMQKVGMTKEGVMKKASLHQGKYHDKTMYAIIN